MAVAVDPTLESLVPGAVVHGVLPDAPVEVVHVAWHGSAAVTLTYRRADGHVQQELLYRADEARLRVEAGRATGRLTPTRRSSA